MNGCFHSAAVYMGHQAEQIKRGWALIWDPRVIILLWHSAIKEYHCTYVTVISFLVSNFCLWFHSWKTLCETWTLVGETPYLLCLEGLFELYQYKLWLNETEIRHHQLLCWWRAASFGVNAPSAAPRQRSRKAHKSNTRCTCELLLPMPLIIKHLL